MDLKSNSYTIEGEKAYFTLFPTLCKGCGLCMEKCPVKVIEWSDKLGVYGTPAVQVKEDSKCTGCKICELVCPDCAITITPKRKAK